MRLEEFRKLSKKEQNKQVQISMKEITIAGKELDKKGTWNKNAWKELKEKGKTKIYERYNRKTRRLY